MFVVKLEAPSLPEGWLLHSDSASTSRYFSSPSLPRTAVMVCVCWSNTPTWVQKLATKN